MEFTSIGRHYSICQSVYFWLRNETGPVQQQLVGKAPRDLNQFRAFAKVMVLSGERLIFDEPDRSVVRLSPEFQPAMASVESDWQHVFLEVSYRPVTKSN